MKAQTDSNGKNLLIKKRIFISKIFIEDDFHQSLNVTISVNDPSSSSTTPPIYERQRTIHCQKQVSKKKNENSF
jgi:hypothetical protein